MNIGLKSGTSSSRSGRKAPLGRDAWLTAAKLALIREGIGGVEIGKLARRLRVTRGGFYWFFKSRRQLLNALLASWEEGSDATFGPLVRDRGAGGRTEYKALRAIWIHEEPGYDPRWDAAVREWGRISPRVAAVVQRVDTRRIEVLQRIFVDLGHAKTDAFVRARIAYFHQVGYHTLGVRESRSQRLRLLPIYNRILTGQDI